MKQIYYILFIKYQPSENVHNDKKIIYSDMQSITVHKNLNDNTYKKRSWPLENIKKKWRELFMHGKFSKD